MSLLKDLLMKKKIFEAEQDIEKFLEDNEIPDDSIVHKIMFKKSEFDEQQVVDFMEANWLHGFGAPEEVDGHFESVIFDEIAFVKDMFIDVEIRVGVIVVVGLLRPMTSDNPLMFSDKDGGNYKFNSDHPYVIEIARVSKGFHARYGEVELTEDDLKSFKDNFDNDAVGLDISIDFDHETREAAGWVKEMFLSEDGQRLLAGIRWTPKGALALSNREFRYFSPEFSKSYENPHTRVFHGPTLLGGGLVNRPFLRMEAIVSLKNKDGGSKVDTIKLSEHKATVSDLENQISTLKLSEVTAKGAIDGIKAENVKLSDELKGLKEDADKKKKEDEINTLFSDQKINQAQKDAMLLGKSMLEVLNLSEKMNTNPKGKNGADNKDIVNLSDKELSVCKQLGLTPEEYIEANKEEEA